MQSDKWDQRLTNWALWKAGAAATPFSGVYRSGENWEWWEHPPRNPAPLVGEALDTDKLIKLLIDEQQEAINVVYLWSFPETLEDRAKQIGIHRNTLTNRVNAAKERLEDLHAQGRRDSARVLAMVTR